MNSIQIEDYSEKSFVVRGETREYKDALKNMGGKWNSRLTDKQTSDKFGAWLFWSDKRKEVEEWMKMGCPVSVSQSRSPSYAATTQRTSSFSSSDLKRIENKIDKLLSLVDELVGKKVSGGAEIVVDSDDEEDKTPPRRLLQKKNKI